MGTIKATNIQTITGSGTLTLGTSGETLALGSGVTVSGNGLVGITMADQWRLTADLTGDHNPISTNLERVDTAGQGYIAGSLMSESSGVFTFPSTGIYNVTSNMVFQCTDHADTAMDNDIYITINNSSYTHVARTQMGQQGDSSANTGCVASTLVDVTDTANVKVKFAYSSVNNTNVIQGGTTENRTFFTFIRLGDT
jgi:hypothetical protein